MTRTYTSLTYGGGAVLGLGFVGVAAYGWLHLVGFLGRAPVVLVSGPSIVLLSMVLLMGAGVFFAVGRTWVRVSVQDGVLRIERRLRRSLECPLEGLSASVRLVDSADATPGPRLVRNPKRSAAIRSAIRLILGSRDLTGSSRAPASEDFARVELRAADGQEHVVLLPGVSSLDQLDDLRASVPFELADELEARS